MPYQKMSKQVALCGALALLAQISSVSLVAAQSATDRVLKDGKITIGVNNNSPWSFVDETGTVVGLQPNELRAVLGSVGLKEVEFVPLEWNALIPSLMAKRIDAIATGMSITPQRCEQVIFANPDVAVTMSAVVLATNPKKIHSFEQIAKDSSIHIAADRGTLEAKALAEAGIPSEQIMLLPDSQTAFGALLGGRVDAYAATTVTVTKSVADPRLKGKLEAAAPFTGLVKEGEEMAFYPAVVFRNEDAKLRDIYNDGLQKTKKDGTLREIIDKLGFNSLKIAPETVTAKSLCGGNYR
ncbi:ectoine/hydroxyectoine ABC transporter substrate-binding protein EhuB [Sinorhizobium meliloti]|uniref:ectoine/hydroxyectoine ABC transporter substrate-binding protein EhuB n=1 Tax=Rhizobium meliloti TaxID=382 RepID=UPI000B4A12FB|nr:ectoine/hydroxyectoine ABC transporter substrate-binding protein EhuB [Sinorhizobium meliloti]ASP87143.1 ectoine/hydroxyectoine ABC transporter substrate-binding protein EhuB [Sinorhizobium meliloti]MQW27151.1 ectoine/hydroxyectoine ABC transporter substrate-binding protein EhuB [Sinorhizobium meliloti]RVJ62419.1 ectoine/hydroxyectoine ABC transporter substrate-binding protein EhuB [Sinorhizobium meliloti]